MASRPFHTSTKEPMSVKLRGLNASKQVTRQLEIDSRRMEERLRELKMTMNREKQERERQGSAGSGGIWSSGKPGALTTHGSDLVKKKSPTKPAKPGEPKARKIKVLKDTPIEVPKRAAKKPSAGDMMNTVRHSSGPACGQCEERAVALTCKECGENYCAGCFAKFHLKGALRQHRSIPYQSGNNGKSPNTSSKPTAPKTTPGADSRSKNVARVIVPETAPSRDATSNQGESIFDGEYDEDESAASFAAALAEWRQAKKGGQQTPSGPKAKKSVHDMGSGTSSVGSDKKHVEINFHDNASLSYADRLLLKKHRRTELPSALSPTPSQLANHYLPRETFSRTSSTDLANGHYNPSEEELEMEEEHRRYADIFGGGKHKPSAEIERPKSSVTIVEIMDEDVANERDTVVQSVYSVQEWDAVMNTPSPREPVERRTEKETDVMVTEVPDDHQSSVSSGGAGVKPLSSTRKEASAKAERSASRSSTKPKLASTNEKRLTSQRGHRPSSAVKTRNNHVSRPMENDNKELIKMKSNSNVEAKTTPASHNLKKSARQQNKKESFPEEGRKPAAERPPSAGITTLPSSELRQIGRMQVPWQHKHGYTEGLGSFFSAGAREEKLEAQTEKSAAPGRDSTPTNELPECSYKGPSNWRPDSSLSNVPNQDVKAFSPSPPKQARDVKSPGMTGRKRSSVTTATVGGTSNNSARPAAASSKLQKRIPGKTPRESVERAKGMSEDDSTLHWVLSQQQQQQMGVSRPTPTHHGNHHGNMVVGAHSAATSASTMPPRSSSRIEVDGDDLTSYDEDGKIGQREEEDKETLEQLTWELASNEGRVTADGRISSMSLIPDLDEDKILLMSEEFQDLALGIVQDDGLGSGLSTPCNELSMERLSEEELRSDFEVAADNQRYREEVEALH